MANVRLTLNADNTIKAAYDEAIDPGETYVTFDAVSWASFSGYSFAKLSWNGSTVVVDSTYAATLAAASLIASAQAALTASDVQVIRCIEAGTTLPDAWKTYRTTLRTIVSTGAGAIPTRPDWPA